MAHMPPFRLNVGNLGPELTGPPPNPKKRRKNNQAPQIQAPPSVQDLLPPPLTGYGDTIVASNPFDDCPSNVNTMTTMGRPQGPPMGMGGPPPGMHMAMCRPPHGMGGPMGGGGGPPMMQHSPGHPMGPGGPMGPGNGPMGPGNGPMGPGGGPMGPRGLPPGMGMHHGMAGPPMHSPIGMGGMGGMSNCGPPMGPSPMNGPPMGSPMNGPPMGSPMGSPMNGPMGGMPMNGPPMMGGPPPHPQQLLNNNNFLAMGGGGGGGNSGMYGKPMPVGAGKVYPADQPMVFNSQNPNAPPIYPCGVCHKEVHDNDQAILCESGCNFWFHRGCTGLTESAFLLLTAEVYAEWVCDKCLATKNIPLVKFKP